MERLLANNQCDPVFFPLLSPFQRESFDKKGVTVCGVWRDMRIAFLNRGWHQFSAENGGEPAVSDRWHVGTNLLTGIHGPLREFIATNYRRCIAERRTWSHAYECSSPSHFRLCHMVAYPVGDAEGLLIYHSIVTEAPSVRSEQSPVDPELFSSNNVFHQCSYCRRFRSPSTGTWEWIAAWVADPPGMLSHGICDTCYDYYLPLVETGGDIALPLATDRPPS